MRIFLFIAVLALSNNCIGECIHFGKESRLGVDGGRGTHGLLDGTMSIDCLKFIGIEKEEQHFYGILRDDRNNKYRVRVGTSIGIYGGPITEITNDKIIYEDYIEENGEWRAVRREMLLVEPDRLFKKDKH